MNNTSVAGFSASCSDGLIPGGYVLTGNTPIELDRTVSLLSNDFLSLFRPTVPAASASSGAFFWGPDASSYFVMDNVRDEMALRLHASAGESLHIEQAVRKILTAVGLSGIVDNANAICPLELSGGQQQRLAAGLLMAMLPPLVIGLNPVVYVDRFDRDLLYREVLASVRKAGSVLLLAGEANIIVSALKLESVFWNGEKLESTTRRTPSRSYDGSQRVSNDGKPYPPAENRKVVLTLRNLEWRYPNSRRGVYVESLDIYSGAFYAVCGPNAGGKSSLLRTICSNYSVPKESSVTFLGKHVRNPFHELVLSGHLAMAFQDANAHTVPGTVAEIIKGRLPNSLTATDFQLDDYLGTDLLAAPYWVKQAVSVICALSTSPSILLLDEPMDGFGYSLFGAAVQSQIIALCRRGMTVMVVTHDPELVRGCATDYIWVEDGAIAPTVPSERIYSGEANHRLIQWLEES